MTAEAPVTWKVSTSQTIGALAKALAAAQAAMGPAIKDRVGVIPGKDGRQGYQYGYATLAACFEAIRPMHAQGIAVTQIPLDGGNGVLVATLLIHESGEWIRGEMWMPVTQQTPQGYGSALTYARRYGLSALCGLGTDEDDDGADASRSKPGPAKAPAQAPPPKLDVFARLCEAADLAETLAHLDSVANATAKARRAGEITDSHVEQVKTTVAKKRAAFGQAVNGGAS
jgi:hypothetical protein